MKNVQSLAYTTALVILLSFPVHAQMRDTVETVKRDALSSEGGKSTNPLAGKDGFEKKLELDKQKRLNEAAAEGTNDAKQLGGKAPAGAKDAKPKMVGGDGGQLAAKKAAQNKSFCNSMCGGGTTNITPSDLNKDSKEYGGINTPLGSTQGAKMPMGSGKQKSPEEIKQCVDECLANGGTDGFNASLKKTIESPK